MPKEPWNNAINNLAGIQKLNSGIDVGRKINVLSLNSFHINLGIGLQTSFDFLFLLNCQKLILLDNVFFFDQRGGTVEELFVYIFGIYIKFG